MAGGGNCGCISKTAVLPDDTAPSSLPLSSPESGGDTNRAVGRGPEEDGPLVFFRIGWSGGGLDDEEVGSFIAVFDGEPLLSRPLPWLLLRPPLGGNCEPDMILSNSCWLSLGTYYSC